MSSTRNRNNMADYQQESKSYQHAIDHMTLPISREAATNHFAGNGLLMGRMANHSLSKNACDIESQLFGIGSTNLVAPKATVENKPKSLQSLNVMERTPLIIPAPLKVASNQRPYPMN
jgi:hypothetical protein